MLFRQLFHADTRTYTYLLGCDQTREAILIDPVVDSVDTCLQLLRELNLTLVAALDTHVHADHVTALGALREKTGCTSMMGEPARASCISKSFSDGDTIKFGTLSLKALHTPGHTDDSYSFLLPASADETIRENYLFTGDTLLIRGTGRTDFQNGNASDQYRSLFHTLLHLPDNTRVYPAHDYKGWTSSTIAEERQFNPRLQVDSEQDYVALMGSLKLPSPKWMDVAVPANLACGNTHADA
jgi:glyoxylase-like metal-dependent hydrolase (beta-lactamase superfamily II)